MVRKVWVQGLALAGALACAGVAAQDYRSGDLRGRAEVTDGDTLRIGDARIRLFGIDAPERSQSCEDERGRGWACGTAAADRLRALTAGRTVRCQLRDLDRYGRQVMTCAVSGVDLGGTLVSEGLARAYTRYGDDYAPLEAQAKLERLGLWQGIAEAPWQYRAEKRDAQRPDFEAAAARRPPGRDPAAGTGPTEAEAIRRLPEGASPTGDGVPGPLSRKIAPTGNGNRPPEGIAPVKAKDARPLPEETAPTGNKATGRPPERPAPAKAKDARRASEGIAPTGTEAARRPPEESTRTGTGTTHRLPEATVPTGADASRALPETTVPANVEAARPLPEGTVPTEGGRREPAKTTPTSTDPAGRPPKKVAQDEVEAPAGCAIKGNVGSGGDRVFHIPGGPGYARTRINGKRGDQWFCDEAAARSAGFRAVGEPSTRTGSRRPGG